MKGDVGDFRRKYIEGDLAVLQAETAAQRVELDALRRTVEALGNQVAQLVDDMAGIERANKIVSFRGAS